MKLIALLLVFLALYHARGQTDAGGYAQISVPSNDDPESCILTLSATVQTNQILFTVVTDDPHQDCTHQDLYSTSVFYNDPNTLATGRFNFTDTGVAHTQSVAFTQAHISLYNESSCFVLFRNLGAGGNLDQWQCRFMFSGVYFHINFGYYTNNGSLDTTWYKIIFPHLGFKNVNGALQAITTPNKLSGHQLVGMLYTQCGGWSNVVTDLANTPVTVTGTILQGQAVNLGTYLSGYSINAIVIRKKYDTTGSYLEWKPRSPTFFFRFGGSCIDTGLKYSDLVPDLNYCAGDGCVVTFLLQSGNIVMDLGTNGFVTKAPSRLRV